ncbi:CAP domain-containing protein [Pseudoduganella sp. RAF53_2]|uniref:CAP domain-containing protein n=1 Tax=unclassified Pseudoduganella TaxID=2637179 RepID=UPI003F9DC3ED
MRSKLLLPAWLLAALLTACGGGGGSTSSGSDIGVATPTTPTTPTPTDQPGAPAMTGDTATDGFNWFNYRRAQIGLSQLTRNSRIDAAAVGHSNYLRLNNTVVHNQTAGNPGFTGAALSDRFAAAGYTLTLPYAYGEVISAASDRSGVYHAEELIAAIYHRFVVFEPVFREMGAGAATGNNNYTYFTADLATSNGYGAGVGHGKVVNYPADGQTAVPTTFNSDNESPDPVPNQNQVGYPISVHADISAQISVTTFTVHPRGGSNMTTRLLSRATDAETPTSAAAIIPLSTLQSGTTYDVSFSGTVDSVPVSRNWSFTTK